MFVQVQQITSLIDKRIGYLKEARENKDNFDEYTFKKYEKDMADTLNRNIETLNRVSTNEKLIERYTRKVEKALNKGGK